MTNPAEALRGAVERLTRDAERHDALDPYQARHAADLRLLLSTQAELAKRGEVYYRTGKVEVIHEHNGLPWIKSVGGDFGHQVVGVHFLKPEPSSPPAVTAPPTLPALPSPVNAELLAYQDAHATAVELGYPSITEALEVLSRAEPLPTDEDALRAAFQEGWNGRTSLAGPETCVDAADAYIATLRGQGLKGG